MWTPLLVACTVPPTGPAVRTAPTAVSTSPSVPEDPTTQSPTESTSVGTTPPLVTTGELTVLYVATDGSDDRDGATPETALATLQAANDLLLATPADTDVEIRVAPGTYVGQRVTWTATHPDHVTRVSAFPADGRRPVFDGQGASVFFDVQVPTGEYTNVWVESLEVTDYTMIGIHFTGDPNDEAGWNGGNKVTNCRIARTGNAFHAAGVGYGAIDLANSRENTIEGNEIVDAANEGTDGVLMHGVYLVWWSRNNLITRNTFTRVSGDPLRARDESNDNEFLDNVFDTTGDVAIYSDWFCDHDTRDDCTKPTAECPSWGNAVKYNDLGCGYDGAHVLPFSYAHGVDYVPSGCVDHAAVDGWVRLTTASNVDLCP
ncbi:MAG: right-handed parallel beta-helix repeat-containing protein [Myxococcota bacterium]